MSLAPLLQMGGGMDGGWTVAFIGPFVGLLVMGLFIYLLWRVLSGPVSSGQGSSESQDAMETLRERYARGEIDEETFEERAQRLRNS